MRSSLLAALLLTACTGPATDKDDTAEDTGEADADTDTDTDADTDSDTDTDTAPDEDRDADGFPASEDCDDRRADVNPDVTVDVCNGRDDDCDHAVDEDPDLHWYVDTDGDGYGRAGASSFVACDPGAPEYASNDADCDDDDAYAWPGAYEACDGVDNDCNGETDEDPSTWLSFYRDADGDGAGTEEIVVGCDAESVDGADNSLDCDDTDPDSPKFVATTGASRGTGRIDDPLPSIQLAIDYAPSCVLVAAGTYPEDIDFRGLDITVEGLDGPEATTIRGTGANPVVTFWNGESDAAVLRGFTITGGGGYIQSGSSSYYEGSLYITQYYEYAYGGGVYIEHASPVLEDLVITENSLSGSYSYWADSTTYYYGGSSGGGIYVSGGGPTLLDVDLVANKAGDGGALYHTDDGLLIGTRVRMLENESDYGTLYTVYAEEGWENLILDANSSPYGYAGIFNYYSNLLLTNGALVGNDYGVYSVQGEVTIDNTVIAANTAGLYEGGTGTAAVWTLTYNNVYANGGRDYENVTDPTGTEGNLATAPGFVDFSDDGDADNDDLSLRPGSGMIDFGNPSVRDADGTRSDIGAYGGPAGGGW